MPPEFPVVSGRKVRIALAGCGRVSKNHLSALEHLRDHAELVALCDTDPEALKAAGGPSGAKGYASLEKLLHEARPDVVALATPSGLHPEQAMACADAGVCVLTEKPMATRWEDGRAMVRRFDERGVRLFVVKQNRHNPTVKLLKRAIEQRRFGRIYMVCVNVFWSRPQEYYDSAKWRGTWEFDGGAFMNQASHYVDLLDWLIGPVESVHAYTATLARDIQVEDTGTLGLKWRSGVLGSMNVTMLTYPKNLEGSITVLGEKGTVRLGGVALNVVEAWQFAEPHEDDAAAAAASYDTASVYGAGHQAVYDNVIRVMRGEALPEVDGREGLRSLELLVATYLSARNGTRVSLPLGI